MRNRQTGELAVCGLNAVTALCARHPERVSRLFFTAERAGAFGPMCKSLAAAKKVYRLVEDEQLEKLAKTEHHQGVVAMREAPELPQFTRAIADSFVTEGLFALFLENLGNPHNVGAIVRNAAFLGLKKIVLVGKDCASLLSTSSFRVAEGGMEYVDLYQAVGIGKALLGDLPLIAFDQRGAQSLFAESLSWMKKGKACGFLVGNEETGISRENREICAGSVCIPGKGTVESLNVAQATAILVGQLAAKGLL